MTESSDGAAEMVKEADVTPTTVSNDTEVGDDISAKPKAGAAEEPPTLRQIFSIPEKAEDRSDEHWQAFEKRLAEEVKGIKWTAAMSDLVPRICDLLDIKVHNILLTAWKKAEALHKVLEDSKATPEKSVYLDLADHSIDYEGKPFIDVKLKGATVKKLTLSVSLNLKLKAALLKVQNGAIREIQAGSCEGKGTIKYGTLVIAEKKLTPIKFPLSIKVPSLSPLPEEVEEVEESKPAVPAGQEAGAETATQPLERIEL